MLRLTTVAARLAATAAAGVLIAATAGCGGAAPTSGAATGEGPTPGATPAVTTASTVATAATRISESPRVTPTTVGTDPVLGVPDAPFSKGIGDARPGTIDLGGASSSGFVEDVTWQNWGGPTATGSGMAAYIPPGAPTAAATRERATIVASNLGDCSGKQAYRSLVWFFPQHGETATTHEALDICMS